MLCTRLWGAVAQISFMAFMVEDAAPLDDDSSEDRIPDAMIRGAGIYV